jgi:hypothetical protein
MSRTLSTFGRDDARAAAASSLIVTGGGFADEAEFVVRVRSANGAERLHGVLHNRVVGHRYGIPWRRERAWRLASLAVVAADGTEHVVPLSR